MTWDHAFAGGGIAACSLALRIVRDGLGSVLLVDRHRHDPRTFAFWTDRPTGVDDLIAHSWDRVRIVGEGGDRVLALGAWRYAMIRGQALRDRAQREIVARGGKVLTGHVDRVEDDAIVVDGARHAARWVYDSRLDVDRAPLLQSFHGWWIETPEDAFDPGIATLMDFRTAQEPGGIRFFHLLPTSARQALVTGVNVAFEARPVDLGAWLEVAGIRDWRITAEERGATSLDPRPVPRRLGPTTLAIGRTGGLLKASTGYAFTRIQDDAERIAASLRATGVPFAPTPTARGWRLLDAVLLRVVARRGPASERVFVALFTRNPIDRVLRFLDERASLREILLVVLTMPAWRWFLAALWR